MYGYAGKLLFVDLSKRTLREEPLTDAMARNFIGGYGLGARVLYSMMKPGADALGPDNVLGIVTGPVTGTDANFSGRQSSANRRCRARGTTPVRVAFLVPS